jgi:hypothetical protein
VSELEELSNDKLLQELGKAETELEDVEEIQHFALRQTGMRINVQPFTSMRASWEREEARLRRRVEAIRTLLAR